jgi:hypothetical protein
MMTAIVPGAKFGNLIVIGIDATARRIACRCVCSRVITLASDALREGASSCGCKPLTPQNRDTLRKAREHHQRQRSFLAGSRR